MARVKRSVKRHNKRERVLGLAKGFWGAKSSNYRTAKEAVEKSLLYAYRDRRAKKRDFRRLWIIRVKAGAMANGLTYSRFIQGLKKIGSSLDRKVLAEMAVNAPEAFARVVAQVKNALA
jgi:large subunit ribosomal protein L20